MDPVPGTLHGVLENALLDQSVWDQPSSANNKNLFRLIFTISRLCPEQPTIKQQFI